MPNPLDVELHPLEATTASGAAAAVDIGEIRRLAQLTLHVTAASGTDPTLAVYVETSPDGNAWRQVRRVPEDSGAGETIGAPVDPVSVTLVELDRYLRVRWEVGGTTPSVTWSLKGRAHVVYADPSDLPRLAIPMAAINSISMGERGDKVLAASTEADAYINGAYTLPLSRWGTDLRMHVAALSAYLMVKQRGYDPGSMDEQFRDGRNDAIAYLNRIANGRLKPPDIVDTTPETFEGGSVVMGGSARGW